MPLLLESSRRKLQEIIDWAPSLSQQEIDRMAAMNDKEFVEYYHYVMDEDFDGETDTSDTPTATPNTKLP